MSGTASVEVAGPARFVIEDGRAVADVGDGVVGPAGVVELSLGSLELEMDRADGRVLTIAIEMDEIEDDEPPWAPLVPGLEAMTADPSDRQVTAEIALSERFARAAHTMARIDTECLWEDGPDSSPVLRTASYLELVKAVADLQADAPSLYGGASGLDLLAQQAELAWGALDEYDRRRAGDDPQRGAILELLRVEAVGVVPSLADSIRFERVEAPGSGYRGRPSVPDRPHLVLRGGGRPRSGPVPEPIDDGRFLVDNEAVTLRYGEVQQDPSAAAYRVEVGGARRHTDAGYGPLWVQLYSDWELAGGGVIELDEEGTGSVTVPVPDRESVDAVLIWVNPYRYAVLRRPRPAQEFALDALRRARHVLAKSWREPDREAWQELATDWLAAGFFDRAALAYGYAGDEASRIWVRADAVRARLEAGVRLFQPKALAWRHR